MDQQNIDFLTYVQESLDADPIKDFLDESDLVEALNTLFIILDEKLPNWKKEVEFDEEGYILWQTTLPTQEKHEPWIRFNIR